MSKEEGPDRDIINNFFAFQTRRKITNLYKQFFFILEDLQVDGSKNPEETHKEFAREYSIWAMIAFENWKNTLKNS